MRMNDNNMDLKKLVWKFPHQQHRCYRRMWIQNAIHKPTKQVLSPKFHLGRDNSFCWANKQDCIVPFPCFVMLCMAISCLAEENGNKRTNASDYVYTAAGKCVLTRCRGTHNRIHTCRRMYTVNVRGVLPEKPDKLHSCCPSRKYVKLWATYNRMNWRKYGVYGHLLVCNKDDDTRSPSKRLMEIPSESGAVVHHNYMNKLKMA